MGGHGRTGIQLACLRWFLATEEERKEWPDAHTLIMAIRKPYCDKAVEADKQQAYVAQMCGIPNGPILGFHKGTITTYNKQEDKKITSSNISLLECDACDFVAFEDPDEDLEEGDFCYDYTCKGHLQDVTEFSLGRHDVRDAHNYQICLYTLDVCSDISAFRLETLSKDLMVEVHGKDWEQILQRLMSKNNKNSVRGKILRNLWDELQHPTAENILVVLTDALSDPIVKNGKDKPDFSKKYTDGKHSWSKCGLCDSSTSPHRLTVAFTNKKGKDGAAVQEAHAICGCCISKSGMEMMDRLEAASHDIVTMGNKVYTLVEGLSPAHSYTPTSMRAQNKYKTESDVGTEGVDYQLEQWERDLEASEAGLVDDKKIKEGLLELGLGPDDPESLDPELLDQLDELSGYESSNSKIDYDLEDFEFEYDEENFVYAAKYSDGEEE
jgi:hypothetical protein